MTHLGDAVPAVSGLPRSSPRLLLVGTRTGTLLGAAGTTASLLLVIGGYWDVWWHLNLGRDTFWTRPPMLMYAEVVTGVALGAVGLTDPFGPPW